MKVSLLSMQASSVSDVLRSHGWEVEMAQDTAAGLSSAAFHISGISTETIEAMLPVANRLGIQMISGPDWLLLVGPHSRVGAFARPWLQPEAVQELAMAIGMAMPAPSATAWHTARGIISLERTLIMGILNVTPDSFSDGGEVLSVEAALIRTADLLRDGAGILDVGGESTRPGARAVSVEEEMRRVIPVVAALALAFPELMISIDTTKHEVAAAAMDAGAAIINDVTAGRHDPEILAVAARTRAGMVLSHSTGPLGQIANLPTEDDRPDIVIRVVEELANSRQAATAHGIADDAIVLDPGLGFGKGVAENMRLLQQLDTLVALGRPVMVGPSRKRFLGTITGREVGDRDRATAAACAMSAMRGARIVRVHEPSAVVDAVRVGEGMKET